ncbi:hypothetical protein ACFL6S_23425 [Candidatus Poribacteria bacterium]
MYTYKRFGASRSAVIIVLIALALVACGILGLTGTPLAGKPVKATFDVTLYLQVVGGLGYTVIGTAKEPMLAADFRKEHQSILLYGMDEETATAVDCYMMTGCKKGGKVGDSAANMMLHFYKDGEVLYGTDCVRFDVTPPDAAGVFTLKPIEPDPPLLDVYRSKGKHGREEVIGTVIVGNVVYSPQ